MNSGSLQTEPRPLSFQSIIHSEHGKCLDISVSHETCSITFNSFNSINNSILRSLSSHYLDLAFQFVFAECLQPTVTP